VGEPLTVSFLDRDGVLRRMPLSQAAGLPFYNYPPVRGSGVYRGQEHWPGLYWYATTRAFVPYESRLELSRLLLFDFDPNVGALSAQPFRLHFLRGAVKCSHVPDFFLRLADGRERVIDVKPSHRLHDPKVRAPFDATREASRLTGWDYQVLSEPDATLLQNVRWLAGFRRSMNNPELTPRLVDACRAPTHFGLVSLPGVPPARIRPALFHLLWTHVLSADLTHPLTDATVVSAS